MPLPIIKYYPIYENDTIVVILQYDDILGGGYKSSVFFDWVFDFDKGRVLKDPGMTEAEAETLREICGIEIIPMDKFEEWIKR
jgi:hypothetical protein